MAQKPGKPVRGMRLRGESKVAEAPAKVHVARAIRIDIPADKFPGDRNAQLERALHIHYAMVKGLSRDEAVRLADERLGPGPAPAARPGPKSAARRRKA